MKIKIIVLASGLSRRFHTNKLLTNFQGKPLFQHCLEPLYSLHHEVDVVSHYEDIKDYCDQHGFRYLLNEHADHGISESIKIAIRHNQEVDGLLFMVADQPFIQTVTILKMLEHFNDQHIVCASVQDELKNPVLFPKCYFEELLQLEKDQGGKKVVHRHLDHVFKVEMQYEIESMDVDTLEDYNRLSAQRDLT